MEIKLSTVLLLIILVAVSIGLGIMIGETIMINRAYAQNQIVINQTLQE